MHMASGHLGGGLLLALGANIFNLGVVLETLLSGRSDGTPQPARERRAPT